MLRTSGPGDCGKSSINAFYRPLSLTSLLLPFKFSLTISIPQISENSGFVLFQLRNWHYRNRKVTIRNFEVTFNLSQLIFSEASLEHDSRFACNSFRYLFRGDQYKIDTSMNWMVMIIFSSDKLSLSIN